MQQSQISTFCDESKYDQDSDNEFNADLMREIYIKMQIHKFEIKLAIKPQKRPASVPVLDLVKVFDFCDSDSTSSDEDGEEM